MFNKKTVSQAVSPIVDDTAKRSVELKAELLDFTDVLLEDKKAPGEILAYIPPSTGFMRTR